MKYLGIDYGDSKVGLAIGDSASGLALPYKILANRGAKGLLLEIKNICQQEKINQIIVGVPFNTQAKTATPAEKKVRDFIQALQAAVALPISEQSEIFSTKAAQKLSPGKRDDDLAAMLILQSYLDKDR